MRETHPQRSTPRRSATERGVLFGIAVFRVVTALWASVVAVIDAESGVMANSQIGLAVLGPVLAWSLTTLWLSRSSPDVLLSPVAQGFDLLLGAAVVVAEWTVYDGPHSLNFGATWQVAPVLSTAVAHGPVWGTAAGLGLGVVNGVSSASARGLSGNVLATLSTLVLLGAAGAAVGTIMRRLRSAEDEVAEAAARERVARRLHDGVLQTLAAVQRRSGDAELVRLAADQDRELREWIRSESAPRRAGKAPDVATEIRRLAATIGSRDGIVVDVVVVAEPRLGERGAAALLVAVGEAVTNAAKHSGADRVTVFLDVDSAGVLCTVHDDGRGFDTESGGGGSEPGGGMGIELSIRRPIEEVGGSVALRSRPGVGTEVELRIP